MPVLVSLLERRGVKKGGWETKNCVGTKSQHAVRLKHLMEVPNVKKNVQKFQQGGGKRGGGAREKYQQIDTPTPKRKKLKR